MTSQTPFEQEIPPHDKNQSQAFADGSVRRACFVHVILHKSLEGRRWATEQAGNCIRDGCCRTGGKIGQQVTHRLDVPIGHSRFAHSVRCCRDRYVHVLNFPGEYGRQLFGNLLKGQGFRPGDDIGLPFVTGIREYLSCDRADVADIHCALRRVLKRLIEHALRLDRVGE